MFKDVKKIYSLLIGNHLESCKKDVEIFEKILKKYNSFIKISFDCNPQNEIVDFLKNKKLEKDDLLIIHYSGHGERIGKRINNKMEMISTWLNSDETHTYSFNIDKILSNLNCKIILSSDSCYSGNFGKFYNGNGPFIFIGSSNFFKESDEYKFEGKYSGALVNLFKYILSKKSLYELDEQNLKELTKNFYNINKIRLKPVIVIKGL